LLKKWWKIKKKVLVAKFEERHGKNEVIVMNKNSDQNNDCIVFNLEGRDKDGSY